MGVFARAEPKEGTHPEQDPGDLGSGAPSCPPLTGEAGTDHRRLLPAPREAFLHSPCLDCLSTAWRLTPVQT